MRTVDKNCDARHQAEYPAENDMLANSRAAAAKSNDLKDEEDLTQNVKVVVAVKVEIAVKEPRKKKHKKKEKGAKNKYGACWS